MLGRDLAAPGVASGMLSRRRLTHMPVRSVCSITFRREVGKLSRPFSGEPLAAYLEAHSLEELDLADLISELLRLAVVDGAVSDSGKSQISVEEYMASLALEQQKQMEAEMEELAMRGRELQVAMPKNMELVELGDADAEAELPQLDVAVDSVRTAGGDYNWVLLGMQKPPAPTDKAAEDKPSNETKKTQDAAAEAKKVEEGRLAQAAIAEKEENERLAREAAAAAAAEAAAAEAKKAEEAAAIKAKKAEEERLAKEMAASEAKKVEEERQAKEAAAAAAEAKKAEEERLAKEIAASEAKKVEEERQAKEAAKAAEANKLEEVRMAEEVAAANAKKAEQERLAKGSAVAAAVVAVAEASKVEEEQLAKDAAGKEERRAKEANAIAEATKGQPAQEASVKLDPLKVSSATATRSRASQSDKGYPRRASQPASTMSKDVSAVAVGASVRPEASSMPPKDHRFDQPSSPAPGRAAPRLAGKMKLKSGWGWWWARRHVELRAGKLQWWRKEPQGPPDVELRLSDGITRWVLMRHEGAILELVCESRSGSSSKAMGERVLLRMESHADALEWAKALREEMEYVEALLSWPMPLEGRQGDVRYYGIEYPS
ncbi:unnamed protein product [Symbiodinium sp. CCMP2592]|nr:unnamed protein product [Symbiodinium sp. CCMP2592]